LNPRPLGYEQSRHCSTSGIILRARPAFADRTWLWMDHLPSPGGWKGLGTRTSLRARSETLRVTRINPRLWPWRQEAVDGGEWVGNAQYPNPPRCRRAVVTECDEQVKRAIVAPRRTPNIRLIVSNRFRGCESADRPVRKRHRRAARADRAVARAPMSARRYLPCRLPTGRASFRAATDSPR
jgi:hypothetical protein